MCLPKINPQRVRNWCFTSFEDQEPNFIDESYNYYIYQREQCPNTGTKHWQGAIKFKHPRNFAGLHRKWPEWHWEPCRDWAAAKKYCSKLESRIQPPVESGSDSTTDWKSKLPSELWESDSEWMVRHHRAVQAYHCQLQPQYRETTVLYLWGQQGLVNPCSG